MDSQTFDIIILIFRILIILLLYFFIFLVVRAILREYDFNVRRSRAVARQQREAAYYPAEDAYPASTGTGRLVVTDPGNSTTVREGSVFELGPVNPIGRRADNAIILNDDFVSTEHALIAQREGRWWLSDVASTNGTFLNGQPLQQPTLLEWGDLVGIGRVRLRLEP